MKSQWEFFFSPTSHFPIKQEKPGGRGEATVVTLVGEKLLGDSLEVSAFPLRGGKRKHVSHPDCLSSSINLCLLTQQHDVTINSTQSLNAVQKGALCSQQGLPVLLHCGTHPLHFQRSLGLFQTFNFNSFFFPTLFHLPFIAAPPQFFFFSSCCRALSPLLWLQAAPLCLYPCYESTCDDSPLICRGTH